MKKSKIKTLSSLATIMIMAMTSINAMASSDSGKRPGPPPAAIDACNGKQVGDSVTFIGRNGEQLEAVCKEIEGQLAAAPPNFQER